MSEPRQELERWPANPKNSYDVFEAALSDVLSLFSVPAGGLASLFIKKFREEKLKESQDILVKELRDGRIHILNDENARALIPASYHFFEAAQSGEYAHNLRILAKLLASEMEKATPDPGVIARNRRRLEAMQRDDLSALVAAHRVFDEATKAEDFDGAHLFIESIDLAKKLELSPGMASAYLGDFMARGFLTLGGNPKVIGGQFYYKAPAFDEIIAAAVSTNND